MDIHYAFFDNVVRGKRAVSLTLSGKFLHVESCYPESFGFLRLWVPGEESINKYPIISVNTQLFLPALAPHLNFENLSLTSCDAILLVQDSSFLELWQRSKKWDFNKKAFHVVFAPYKEIWRLSHSVCWIYFQVQATFSCSKSMSRTHQISSKHAN